MIDDARRLFSLYVRPHAALGEIIDSGGILVPAMGVLLVSGLMQLGTLLPMLTGTAPAPFAPPPRVASPRREVPRPPPPTGAFEDDEEQAPVQQRPNPLSLQMAASSASLFGSLGTVVALLVIYVPSTILLVTLLARVGSFGVALRRDYGPLAACLLSCWAAAFLPIAIVRLGLAARPMGPPWIALALSYVGVVAFGVLAVLAVQTVFGVPLGVALGTVAVSWVPMLCSGFLSVLASPFLLFYAWAYLRGDVGDILGSFGARQSFKRYLEAATLNPRDAEAHYQLGLIHQQRRQTAEAKARFERAVEIDPAEVDAHFQLARIARAEERWEDAIRHLEEVLARDPKHARHEAWREAGAVYVATGAFEHARTVLERFVEARAWDPEGLYLLGLVLRTLGDAQQAKSLFARCIESAGTAPDYRKGELREWKKKAEQELAALGRDDATGAG